MTQRRSTSEVGGVIRRPRSLLKKGDPEFVSLDLNDIANEVAWLANSLARREEGPTTGPRREVRMDTIGRDEHPSLDQSRLAPTRWAEDLLRAVRLPHRDHEHVDDLPKVLAIASGVTDRADRQSPLPSAGLASP
jgi:hypothetical protein